MNVKKINSQINQFYNFLFVFKTKQDLFFKKFNSNKNQIIKWILLHLLSFKKITYITMNLHEYQGKEILNSFGVRIQRGIVAQLQLMKQ